MKPVSTESQTPIFDALFYRLGNKRLLSNCVNFRFIFILYLHRCAGYTGQKRTSLLSPSSCLSMLILDLFLFFSYIDTQDVQDKKTILLSYLLHPVYPCKFQIYFYSLPTSMCRIYRTKKNISLISFILSIHVNFRLDNQTASSICYYQLLMQ